MAVHEEVLPLKTDDANAGAVRLAALLTVFNRKALTVRCIQAALVAARKAGVELDIFLVDDGSDDGTAAAVEAVAPGARIIQGDGKLYWNGGMRTAWQAALPGDYDGYLWLNDDLAVEPDALTNLLKFKTAKALECRAPFIIVGRVDDPDSGETSYGGLVRDGTSPLRIRYLMPDEEACDTMHGNFVLVPREVVSLVGIHSDLFRHHFGDFDYGFRARKEGVRIFQAPFPVGAQKYNVGFERSTSYIDSKNWRFILFHPKGVPLREQFHFCRMHAGKAWLPRFLYFYLKLLFRGMILGLGKGGEMAAGRR